MLNQFLNSVRCVSLPKIKRMFTIVAAIGENNELAKDDQMLWSLPDDYQRFKAITKHHPVIMGRKSVPTMLDVLKNRTVFAITRDKNYKHENVVTVNSLQEAMQQTKAINLTYFNIGGGQIYHLGIDFVEKIKLLQ